MLMLLFGGSRHDINWAVHTVNNWTQLICCVYFLYGAGELSAAQPYFGHATSVNIYPRGTHVVRASATEQLLYSQIFRKPTHEFL